MDTPMRAQGDAPRDSNLDLRLQGPPRSDAATGCKSSRTLETGMTVRS